MKKVVLNGSAASIILATAIATSVTLFSTQPEFLARGLSVASFFGLLSVGLFFVGLVYPKD